MKLHFKSIIYHCFEPKRIGISMTDESSDQPKTKSNPPTSKFVEKLKAYRDIILAVAALATAIGSWFRPTDTTATENSFDWTSKQIEKLSADNIKTQQDIVALHNFLEGYLNGQTKQGQLQEKIEIKTGSAPKPRKSGGIRHSTRVDKSFEPMGVSDESMALPSEAPEAIQEALQEAIQAAPPEAVIMPLPELRPVSEPIKKPRFEDVIETK